MLQGTLVNEIQAVVQDEVILSAFQFVPRHEFVPSFLDPVPGRPRQWKRISASDEPEEWIEKVYTNRPLVTSIDEKGYPTCSSSQPDLMALMMQSALVMPRARVLEVGTGTGYNAALLSAIVGPSHVTSIDIDSALIDVARARIERTVGPGVRLLHGDGRNLPSDLYNAFDVIIVAGAHERIEPSWIESLVPGGRIVFNWIKSFAKVMIVASKVGDHLEGRVCEYRGDFMGLHDGNGIVHKPMARQKLEPVDIHFPIELLSDSDFGFFLQINMPVRFSTYTTKRDKIYVLRDALDNRITQFSAFAIRGDASLAQEISAIAQNYEELGRPRSTMFALTASSDGSMAFTYEGHTFCVRDLRGSYGLPVSF